MSFDPSTIPVQWNERNFSTYNLGVGIKSSDSFLKPLGNPFNAVALDEPKSVPVNQPDFNQYLAFRQEDVSLYSAFSTAIAIRVCGGVNFDAALQSTRSLSTISKSLTLVLEYNYTKSHISFTSEDQNRKPLFTDDANALLVGDEQDIPGFISRYGDSYISDAYTGTNVLIFLTANSLNINDYNSVVASATASGGFLGNSSKISLNFKNILEKSVSEKNLSVQIRSIGITPMKFLTIEQDLNSVLTNNRSDFDLQKFLDNIIRDITNHDTSSDIYYRYTSFTTLGVHVNEGFPDYQADLLLKISRKYSICRYYADYVDFFLDPNNLTIDLLSNDKALLEKLREELDAVLVSLNAAFLKAKDGRDDVKIPVYDITDLRRLNFYLNPFFFVNSFWESDQQINFIPGTYGTWNPKSINFEFDLSTEKTHMTDEQVNYLLKNSFQIHIQFSFYIKMDYTSLTNPDQSFILRMDIYYNGNIVPSGVDREMGDHTEPTAPITGRTGNIQVNSTNITVTQDTKKCNISFVPTYSSHHNGLASFKILTGSYFKAIATG